ncbi:hypothetical protein [Granulicella sp. S156]|uniref:hypothetical protein n=1 Tax=Granulicella sp. S156 TaxID=1747224 RepID=UPI00131CB559|nr:hypothetical protein [Granulicella sp. S156]
MTARYRFQWRKREKNMPFFASLRGTLMNGSPGLIEISIPFTEEPEVYNRIGQKEI